MNVNYIEKLVKKGSQYVSKLAKSLFTKIGEKLLKRAQKSIKSPKTESTTILTEDFGIVALMTVIGVIILALIVDWLHRVDPKVRDFIDSETKRLIQSVTEELSKLKLDVTKETKEFILFYAISYAMLKIQSTIHTMFSQKSTHETRTLWKKMTIGERKYLLRNMQQHINRIYESLNELKNKAQSDYAIYNKLVIAEAAITDNFVIKHAERFLKGLFEIVENRE